MNIEPCVRFGIRIRPKISENPADNRKSRPPNVTLLTASIPHKLTSGVPGGARRPRPNPLPGCGRGTGRGPRSRLQRRIVARIGRLREILRLVVRPELAHILVGLLRDVGELVALLDDLADIHGADGVAEIVET